MEPSDQDQFPRTISSLSDNWRKLASMKHVSTFRSELKLLFLREDEMKKTDHRWVVLVQSHYLWVHPNFVNEVEALRSMEAKLEN